MKVRVAINGFGRIGRNVMKAGLGHPDIEFVAVNDLTDTKTLAHLFKYDTAYGVYDKEVAFDAQHLMLDGQKIVVVAEKDPTKLPWKDLQVDVVLECTGRFTNEEGMRQHITAGAKRVVLSAPAKGGGVPTYVMGVNNYNGKDELISNASCTTNCITPVAAVMHEKFGIVKALMTTVHSYTASQMIQDGPSKDLREARAAAQNIVPTSTGAAIATTEVIPELKGLFDGLSMRVPTIVGSIADFTMVTARKTTVEEVNDVFKHAAKLARWRGILAVTEDPIVSSDIVGNTHSSIVDLQLTRVVDGDLVKVVAWYDNEWGYSHRLFDQLLIVGRSILKARTGA
jgi:glyceraldehyde 3-phosphate dehydrogenase